MDSRIILVRHSAPSKLDHAPWGTCCKVVYPLSDQFDLYKQFGSDENNPHWELIGSFSSDGFDAHVLNEITKT